MDEVKTQMIKEIIALLEITPDHIEKINHEFQSIILEHGETTEEVIKACRVYDSASFLVGALVTTTVVDLARNVQAMKLAEQDRIEGAFRDVV